MKVYLPKIKNELHHLAYKSLLELITEDGINASGKDEVYGCIFGRDSALTILKILRSHEIKPALPLLEASRRALIKLVWLQGKEINPLNGEEPGKFVHEYRKGRLKYPQPVDKPLASYKDGSMRNYDSIDATPLGLIAIYKYYQITQDSEFLLEVIDKVEAALNWIITYGDRDKDGFIEYDTPEGRPFKAFSIQSWTDSPESLKQVDGHLPHGPIAPVEAQAYAWLALKLWVDFYKEQSPAFAKKLLSQADLLKVRFNEQFTILDKGFYFACQALDGDKNQIKTITGNPLICLWASYKVGKRGECIVDNKYIGDFVKRGLMNDLFDKDAGIRTMSSEAGTFNPNQDSYHNGSFWPILNGLIFEGLENWGYKKEAVRLKKASLKPFFYFKSPIELYVKGDEGKLLEFCSASGQGGCEVQAWSAATMLEFSSSNQLKEVQLFGEILMGEVLTWLQIRRVSKLPVNFWSKAFLTGKLVNYFSQALNH